MARGGIGIKDAEKELMFQIQIENNVFKNYYFSTSAEVYRLLIEHTGSQVY